MRYKGRELRRLFEVRVYTGDPDAKRPKTKKETVVAFNAVEAVRFCGGKASKQPEPLCYVTWPEADGEPIFRINDTGGPTETEINPSIPLPVAAD